MSRENLGLRQRPKKGCEPELYRRIAPSSAGFFKCCICAVISALTASACTPPNLSGHIILSGSIRTSARKLLESDDGHSRHFTPTTSSVTNKKLLTEADEYHSTMGGPPPGFEQWLDFAKERKCHLGPYTRIDKDLMVFQDANDTHRRRISKEQALGARRIGQRFVIQDGSIIAEGDPGGRTKEFSSMIEEMGFLQYLPDMEISVNHLDEPRVLPGNADDLDARFNSSQCNGASREFHKFRHLHGQFNNRASWYVPLVSKDLLPLFSQTKISECHADIIFPTYGNWNKILSEEEVKMLLPWEERADVLFFRGSTTGGTYTNEQNFSMAHRPRLLDLARNKPHMNMGFMHYKQCSEVCEKMQERYGLEKWVTGLDYFKSKYLMSIDGNTYVDRLPLLMSSGSLPFRAGLYAEWFDEWIKPKEHFLQIDLDYGNLESTLAWAIEHDEEAKAIGKRAQEFALTRLRKEDMACYMYRLLLEYAAILEK